METVLKLAVQKRPFLNYVFSRDSFGLADSTENIPSLDDVEFNGWASFDNVGTKTANWSVAWNDEKGFCWRVDACAKPDKELGVSCLMTVRLLDDSSVWQVYDSWRVSLTGISNMDYNNRFLRVVDSWKLGVWEIGVVLPCEYYIQRVDPARVCGGSPANPMVPAEKAV